LSHVDEYLTLKYKYKYKYFKMVLEYYSSTSTSTKYYISARKTGFPRSTVDKQYAQVMQQEAQLPQRNSASAAHMGG